MFDMDGGVTQGGALPGEFPMPVSRWSIPDEFRRIAGISFRGGLDSRKEMFSSACRWHRAKITLWTECRTGVHR